MTISNFDVNLLKSANVHTNTFHASNPTILPYMRGSIRSGREGGAVPGDQTTVQFLGIKCQSLIHHALNPTPIPRRSGIIPGPSTWHWVLGTRHLVPVPDSAAVSSPKNKYILFGSWSAPPPPDHPPLSRPGGLRE